MISAVRQASIAWQRLAGKAVCALPWPRSVLSAAREAAVSEVLDRNAAEVRRARALSLEPEGAAELEDIAVRLLADLRCAAREHASRSLGLSAVARADGWIQANVQEHMDDPDFDEH